MDRMSTLRLLYWLGPWANQKRAPKGPTRNEVDHGSDKIWIYHPKQKPIGAIFVLPGIHYEGPADVRLDRFCKVLAAAGFVVGVPFLTAMIRLQLHPSMFSEAKRSLQCFMEHHPFEKTGVFSISAASIVGLSLAADPESADSISGLHCFGGYSDWLSALHFASSGKISDSESVTPEPLGLTVLYLNVLEGLDVDESQRAELAEYWWKYASRTWEKEGHVFPRDSWPIANELAAELSASQRSLFLKGCALSEDSISTAFTLLEHVKSGYEWLDPAPLAERCLVPVYISHGRDDAVVPYTQAADLQRLLPASKIVQVCLTGLYNHTSAISGLSLLRLLPELLGELWSGYKLVRGISRTGTQ